MISTLAGYVDKILDHVTESYSDLREQISPAPRVTLVEGGDGMWQRSGLAAGRDRPLPQDADVTLVLAASRFLVLTLTLPLGAKPYLKGVIASQIDRISPWTAEQAIFGAAVTGETTTGLSVRVAVAAREDIERQIVSLGGIAARSLTLRVPTELDGVAVTIDMLFESGTRSLRMNERRKISAIFFGTIALVILTELVRLGFGSAIENDIRAARSDIARLRDTIAGAALGDLKSDALARMVNVKTNSVPTVELLDALAAVVPDQTYLMAFEVEPGKIHIEGISTAVTDLPKAIGENPAFGDVNFSAPTAKRRDGAGETFQIDIAIKPRQGNEP